MQFFRFKSFALSVVCVAALSASVFAQGITKQYIVMAKGQGKGSTSFAASLGSAVKANLESIGVVVAQSSDPNFSSWASGLSGVQSVTEDVKVQWISPNETSVKAEGLTPAGVNTEPFAGDQWNLGQIHADQAAAAGYRGSGAVVAVLDTGINTGHQDLAGNIDMARSTAFVNSILYPAYPAFEDDVFHGSHVSCIIAAAINDYGIQGVAPEAKIVAVKVLDSTGSGPFGDVISGIEYATGLGVDVINMSLGTSFARVNGGGGGLGPLISALNRAINHATSAGVLVVSSAGNDYLDLNSNYWSIPAQSGNGMAVSATGPIALANFDRLASYSNYGQSVISVAAPGGDFMLYPDPNYYLDMVLSCGNRDLNDPSGDVSTYYFAAGTSMAAPHVSGEAALIVGRLGHVKASTLRSKIEQTADDILKPGVDAQSGKGRINAMSAMTQ